MKSTDNAKKTRPGVVVTLQELITLKAKALHSPMAKLNKKLKAAGLRLTSVRGRGIEFDATREYQAGDDIRNMAWRLTARSLKPHIKVYQEEKERPVWLAVDLSPSLYFGTRAMFKSVRSIKKAAFLGWSYLLKRERIGAVIARQQKVRVFKPHASEQNYLTILNELATNSQQLPHYDETNHLQALLLSLQSQVRSGNLLFIISDFFLFNDDIQKNILFLAQRAQIVLIFVYDPFEAEAPPPHQYVLTNGEKKLSFNMQHRQNRERYQQQFQTKQQTLIDFARRHQIALQVLRTDQIEED